MRATAIFVQFSLCCALGVAPAAARADELVLKSNVPGIGAGKVLRSGRRIALGQRRVLVVLDAAGAMRELRGPAVHTVAREKPVDRSVWSAFTAMFTARRDSTRLGGVRGPDDRCQPLTTASSPAEIAAEWNGGCQHEALNALAALVA